MKKTIKELSELLGPVFMMVAWVWVLVLASYAILALVQKAG